RSSRMMYMLFAAALMFAIVATVTALIQQRRAAQVFKQNEPTPQPSASLTPQPLEPASMVLIPGGGFLMGRNLSESEKGIETFSFDYPAHEMNVSAFYLDVTEVSNREYANFVRATGHALPQGWKDNAPPPGAEDLPATYVS